MLLMGLDFFRQVAAQESRSSTAQLVVLCLLHGVGLSDHSFLPNGTAADPHTSPYERLGILAGLVFNIASGQQAKGHERNGASAARAGRVRIGCYSRKIPVIEHTDDAAVTAVIDDVGSTDIPVVNLPPP